MARVTVESYQETLKKSINNPDIVSSDDLFPSTKGKKPSMPLHNELLMAIVAIAVVITKAMLLLCWKL